VTKGGPKGAKGSNNKTKTAVRYGNSDDEKNEASASGTEHNFYNDAEKESVDLMGDDVIPKKKKTKQETSQGP